MSFASEALHGAQKDYGQLAVFPKGVALHVTGASSEAQPSQGKVGELPAGVQEAASQFRRAPL